MRSASFSEGKLSLLEIGLNSYSSSEKGLVCWESIKTCRLADLQVSCILMLFSHAALHALQTSLSQLGLQAKPMGTANRQPDNAKQLRLDHALALGANKHPAAAAHHSGKESIMLDHVRAFSSIFQELYPQRRQLYLLPQNETGCQKLVCTTIRPTQLPQLSVNNWQGCAEFVARYFAFEPLQNPLQPPAYLPSPASVVEWQVRLPLVVSGSPQDLHAASSNQWHVDSETRGCSAGR